MSMYHTPKLITDFKQLEDIRSRNRLVLTSGAFDLLHIGHMFFLRAISLRYMPMRLIVLLNTDRSIKEYKSKDRPIIPQDQRAFALGSLEYVDHIMFCDEPNTANMIRRIRPDYFVKGRPYTIETIHPDERAALQECGARIDFVPLDTGYSTTKAIKGIT